MFSTDQSHLRRYLTTLGVAIAAGTLSLAGLFLKLEQDLLVTTTTLGQLTPTAHSALLERQRYLAIGTSILPYFVIVGFLGGLSLAAYGLIGWGRRQKVTDALEDLALQKGRVEFRQMTAQEQAEKLNREAKESVADIAPADTAKQVEQTWGETQRQLMSDARNRVMILEASLIDKLRTALGWEAVQPNLHLSGQTFRVTVDAVARVGDRDIVVELKYVASTSDPFRRVREAFRQIDVVVQAVIDAGTSDALGVVLFVISDDIGIAFEERLVRSANSMTDRVKTPHRSIVMRYSEFLSISPNDFVRKLLEDSDGV